MYLADCFQYGLSEGWSKPHPHQVVPGALGGGTARR